jgi:hypothetical protein
VIAAARLGLVTFDPAGHPVLSPSADPTHLSTMNGMNPIHLARLRSICLDLPEVTERLSHGEPTWFVREKRSFATCADHHHDDQVSFWCASELWIQQILCESAPDRFFIPPYVGHRGWIGVRLDGPEENLDWEEIADLLFDAYRLVAPRKLIDLVSGDEAGH